MKSKKRKCDRIKYIIYNDLKYLINISIFRNKQQVLFKIVRICCTVYFSIPIPVYSMRYRMHDTILVTDIRKDLATSHEIFYHNETNNITALALFCPYLDQIGRDNRYFGRRFPLLSRFCNRTKRTSVYLVFLGVLQLYSNVTCLLL